MSCSRSSNQRNADGQVQVARTKCLVLSCPLHSLRSQHDFLVLRIIKVIIKRGLNGSLALGNGVGNALNLSNVPPNAVHVTVEVFHKSLEAFVVLDLGRA
jgi:hypothetical protein